MSMTLPYPSLVFVPLDKLTAEEMNQIVANYTAIANTFPLSSGDIDNLAIKTANIASSAVTGDKLANKAVGSNNIDWSTLPQSFGTSTNKEGYIILGSLLLMWGQNSLTMNGTSAGSFGVKQISYPYYFPNYTRGIALVTPNEVGGTNGLKVAADLSDASSFKVTIGTSQTATSSTVKFSWLVLGEN